MSAISSVVGSWPANRSFGLLTVVALASSLATSGLVHAANILWDGGGDGVSWNDPLNWAGDALPAAGDAVVVTGSFAGTTIVHAGGTTSIASFDGYRLAISGGSFSVSGSCLIRARLDYSGGTLLATPSIFNATLVGSGGVSPVTFIATGSSAFEGTLRAGQTLWVQGGGYGQSAALTWTSGAINDGTIVMETVSSTYNCSIQVPAGSTLLNRGVLSIRPGTFGGRNLYGTLVNEGTVEVLPDTGLYHGGSLVNTGTVDAHANASITLSNSFQDSVLQTSGSIGGEGSILVNAGAFTITGGSIDREITVRNVQIDVGAGVAGEALIVAQVNCGLTNNLSPTTTIWVQGGGYGQSAAMMTSPDTVNDGTILLESVSSSYSSAMSIPTSTVFVNRGLVAAATGTGGPRSITGSGTFRNEGTLAPSVHAALVVSGLFEQTAEGVFRVRFDGTTSGTWARLQCSNPASLAGALEVVRGPKFAPEPGASFICLTAPSLSGAFDSAGGCGVAVQLVQTDTSVACVFGPIDCVADLNLDGLVNGADLTILLSGWGPCDSPAICPGDLNCDGSVNGADLTTLLAAWGACP
jgi:hypothetical protein